MPKSKFEPGDLAICNSAPFKGQRQMVIVDNVVYYSNRRMYSTTVYCNDKGVLHCNSYYSYQLELPTEEEIFLWRLQN